MAAEISINNSGGSPEQRAASSSAVADRVLNRGFLFAGLDLSSNIRTGLQVMGIRTMDQLLALPGNWDAFTRPGDEYSLPRRSHDAVETAINGYVEALPSEQMTAVLDRRRDQDVFWYTLAEIPDVAADLVRLGVTTQPQLEKLDKRSAIHLAAKHGHRVSFTEARLINNRLTTVDKVTFTP